MAREFDLGGITLFKRLGNIETPEQVAGLSFEAKGLAKLAEKNFVEALALAEPNDMILRNALRYRLGRVCESQGKKKEAEDYYNEVAAEDYTYLDVAARLQALNESDAS